MHSHEATIEYQQPLPSGKHRLTLDLFPAIPQSHGPAHDEFVRWFMLVETHEVPGLRTLRSEVSSDCLTSFLGVAWTEALNRWATLRWMSEYRDEHGRDAYAQLDAWEVFYELLADGIVPARIVVSFIEHY